MKRFVRRPHAWVERDSDDAWMPWEPGTSTSMTVMEPEPASHFSGLYDADGSPLYTEDRTRPIGFLKQWED